MSKEIVLEQNKKPSRCFGLANLSMRRWLTERSWRRLIALWAVAYALVIAISSFAAATSNVTIVLGSWAWIVFFQAVVQLLTAALSDYITAEPDEPHGAALATFALSLGALAQLFEVGFSLATTSPNAWAERAHKTMLGAIACTADSAACGDQFRNTIVWLAVVLLPVFCWTVFLLRRQSVARRLGGPPRPQVEAPFVLASVAIAFTFLAVHEWQGVIQLNPPSSPDPTSEELRIADSALSTFRAGAMAAILSVSVLQGLAVWITLGIRRASSASSKPLTRSIVAAVRRSIAFLFFLLLDFLLIITIVIIVSAVAGAIAMGTWNLIDAILFALTFVTRAIIGAFSTIGGDAPLADGGRSTNVGADLGGGLGVAAQVVLGASLVSLAGLLVWGGFPLVVAVGKAIVQGILACLQWLLRTLLDLLVKREAWFAVVAIVGAYFLFFGNPAREPQASATATEVSPSYPNKHVFEIARVDCSAQANGERLKWAFDSAENVALPLDGCQIQAAAIPATVLVLGAASGDDTRQGGFTLSANRGEAVARMARRQFPDANIIIATLGRERIDLPSVRAPDIFSYGRPLITFVSTTEIPAPLRREPLSKTITELLAKHRLFERYETCVLSQYEMRPLPTRFPFSETNGGCRWAKR